MTRIFITGSAGLIGRALRLSLESGGRTVVGCDLRADAAAEKFDLRDSRRVHSAIANCDGIIHLGAVSRVVWGEKNPPLCESVNVGGTRILAAAALASPRKPWFLYASSREVYGNPLRLPCGPDSPINPENTYARTKAEAERVVLALRGKKTAVASLRFSNVFGSVNDHVDRVVPAFARAAANDGILRLEGADNFFDFTHLDDTVAAVLRTVDALESGVNDLPPLDIVTGRATSLLQLAKIAMTAGGGQIKNAPSRGIGAEKFQGDPFPAKEHLGWRARQSLEEMVARLVSDFRDLKHA